MEKTAVKKSNKTISAFEKKMKIRKAKKQDFKYMAQILKTEYRKAPWNEKWTEKQALKTILYLSKIGIIHVAEINNKIAGFIICRTEPWAEGSYLVIEEFVVDSKYQRKGIGKALIKKIEEYSRKSKVKVIYFTTHRKAPAVKFYKKMGYTPSKEAVIFGKKLK